MLSRNLQGLRCTLRHELHSELRLWKLPTDRGSDTPYTGAVTPEPIHHIIYDNGSKRPKTAPIDTSVQFTQTGVFLGCF